MRQKISEVTQEVIYVDGEATAQGLGNVRAANVVLLGALSALMERERLTGAELSAEAWLKVIIQKVPPKYVELNRQAFNLGRKAVTGLG
jgi:indolepyruvate ferredoxin oxidoreductase beta subunit